MTHKILITSALPYANNVPHLGNIVGAVLSADVFARFCRSFGYETLYVCGTDEHGTATETKALEEGVTPQEICDRFYAIHKNIYDWFNISFDEFGRTATEEQKELTQDIFLKLYGNGYIHEERVEQLYCPSCDRFMADRFVEGICPYCDYDGARGDQCDACGKLLNAVELKRPHCKVCSGEPVLKEADHLFLDLEKIEPKLREWIDERSPQWAQNARTITYAWLKEGLKKRAITRDLKWGVPVPLENYKDKVFYVWFDAPIGYLSITKKAFPDTWKAWWKKPEDVILYQFMGKDNIAFHTIIFPASLLGSGDTYTMLHQLSSTEYLNYENDKFSKSRQVGVFGTDAMETGIASDVYRYYLMRNRPERADANFMWHDLMEKNNAELVGNIGNLVNRTMTFLKRFFDGVVPEPSFKDIDNEFLKNVRSEEAHVTDHLKNCHLKEGLRSILHIAQLGNQYFQEKAPWKAVKEDKDDAGTTLYVLVQFVKDLSILIEPYTPDAASRIREQLAIDKKGWADLGSLSIPEGSKLGTPTILFSKLEEEKIEGLRKAYSGKKKFPIDLRAAKVTSVKEHEKADKLYIIHVEVGNEVRQVVAGLRPYYKPEELIGRHVVLVANLKKAKLLGTESNGMLLAAKIGNTVRLVDSRACPVGARLVPVGCETDDAIITINDFMAHPMTVKDKSLIYDKRVITTEDGKPVTVEIADGAQVC